MYDKTIRLPLIIWALFYVCIQLGLIVNHFNIQEIANCSLRATTAFFMLLLVFVTIIRSQPTGKSSGLEPRISALLGTFLSYGLVLFPKNELSLSLQLLSMILIWIGTVGAIISLCQLGRSFSIMPESRQLITSGPYRFVRHPLYLTEEIAVIGIFLQYASIWTAILLLAQIIFQFRRMHNEEMILVATFPEYRTYSQNTARLIPGIF